MTPLTVTITRARHPLEHQTLRVLGRLRRHGVDELLVLLEDNSKSLIPVSWTDLGVDDVGVDDDGDVNQEPSGSALGTIADLLAASQLARALSTCSEVIVGQAAQTPPSKEDNRAPCTAEFAGRPGVNASTDVAGRATRSGRRQGHQPPRHAHRQGFGEGADRGDDTSDDGGECQ